MKKFKVTIVGNSIALRCRPQTEKSKNYGQILEDRLSDSNPEVVCEVLNAAFSRATVADVLKILNTNISNQFPDVFIINLGVCDASTREIPYWYAEILNKKENSLIRHFLRVIHDSVIKKNLSFFVRLRGKKPWISKRRFEKSYNKILTEIKRNSNALVITLSINLPNERVEKLLPGSHVKYSEYNKIIQEVTERQNGTFVSCDDLNSDLHYPDGSHYSVSGHEIVADRLLAIINDKGLTSAV